jgi:hypothetical protein
MSEHVEGCSMPIFHQEIDDSGCKHSMLDGPITELNGFHIFRCPECKNTIARRLLNKSDDQSYEDFIVRFNEINQSPEESH